MKGICTGDGMAVGRWFHDNLLRVVDDGTKTFFFLFRCLNEAGAFYDRFRRLYGLAEKV